jgi:hypothetical protein
MFARYASANTLRAHIRLTQTAMSKEVIFDSLLTYQRPDKINFSQTRQGKADYAPLLISDGSYFVYTPPRLIDHDRVKYLRESVHPPQGAMTIPEIWLSVVDSLTNGDDSFVLEAMISQPRSLRRIRNELESFSNKGKIQIGSRVVNDIEGKWRDSSQGQAGDFAMFVTDEGDIVRMQVTMRFKVGAAFLKEKHLPPNALPDGIEVVSTWDVEAEVNKPLPAGMFPVPSK